MRKNRLILSVILLALWACKNNTEQAQIPIDTDAAVNSSTGKSSINQSAYYCSVEIGNKTENVEYELRSSNSMRKGTIMTTFNTRTSDELYEKHPLDISFTKVENTLNPKLKTGTYELKLLTLAAQDTLTYFSVGENVISKKTYQQAIDANLLDDISDSYVLLTEEANQFTINSVKDIGEVEDGQYYKTGKQGVNGEAVFFLMKATTEEKIMVKVDFNIEHEWSISRSSN